MTLDRIYKVEYIEEVVSFEVRRRRGKRQLSTVIETARGGKPLYPVSKELALPIALGHAWANLMASGRFSSINQLSHYLGKDASYVMHYIRLTTLAPDIVEAIMDGREPDSISQADLLRQLPPEWDGQRRQLGFVRCNTVCP